MPPNHHGTNASYVGGCRCDKCRTATRRYHKELALDHHRGIRRLVPAVGTRRRIEALGALGWTGTQIGSRDGLSGEHIRQLRNQSYVSRDMAKRIAAIYDALSMLLPPERTTAERHNASRQRNKAAREGWAPPLAWDNIDDPNETPRVAPAARESADIDPVVVERILNGDWRLPATKAERQEVFRRWTGSLNDLERLTGWNTHRDRRDTKEAA